MPASRRLTGGRGPRRVRPERGPGGGEAHRAGVDAAGGAGHDQAAGGGGWAAAVNVLSHVPGDGNHGVPVERRDPRARAADRGARVAEDDEALRPDGGHGWSDYWFEKAGRQIASPDGDFSSGHRAAARGRIRREGELSRPRASTDRTRATPAGTAAPVCTGRADARRAGPSTRLRGKRHSRMRVLLLVRALTLTGVFRGGAEYLRPRLLEERASGLERLTAALQVGVSPNQNRILASRRGK